MASPFLFGLNGTEALAVGSSGIRNGAGLYLVADAGVVGGIMACDAGICEGETEKSGRLVLADFPSNAKWLAGQSIVVDGSAFRAGENFANVVV